MSQGAMSSIFSNCASATVKPNIADDMLLELVGVLQEYGVNVLAGTTLSEISNVAVLISSPDLLKVHVPLIEQFRSVSDVLVTSIEDKAAG